MVFQEHTYSVLLVSAGDQFTKTIKEHMPPTHFWPVNAVRSAGEARRTPLGTGADIVLINTPLPDEFGTQLAMDLCERSDAAVLLVVKSERYEDVYAQVTEHGVLTLPKPTSTPLVRQSLRTLCAVPGAAAPGGGKAGHCGGEDPGDPAGEPCQVGSDPVPGHDGGGRPPPYRKAGHGRAHLPPGGRPCGC